MKLSVFIHQHLQEIIVEWESFARTLLPAAHDMSPVELRDHAKQMLEAIVMDMDTAQSGKEQRDKSMGLAHLDPDTESAATSHGALRRNSGFSVIQVTAEFRALRATVLRLWLVQVKDVTEATANDLIRFNETIDQALAESVDSYCSGVMHTRDTFLAILGHDLRNPLSAVTSAGEYLSRSEEAGENIRQLGARVKRSAATMSGMVNDLLEYARSQLGLDIPVVPKWADVGEVCQWALEESRSAHPECVFELEMSGDLLAYVDSARLHQVFANLLNNAALYRAKEQTVRFSACRDEGAVVIQVQNFGAVIPRESLQAIFNPLVQLNREAGEQGRPSTSLGLGLFIAREITLAHGGTISAESNEITGTVFTVRLFPTKGQS